MGVEELDDCKGSTPEKDACGSDAPEAYQDEESSVTEKLTQDSHVIKFIPAGGDFEAKNGGAKIDIETIKTQIGLTKAELMKYANDPFWVRLRMFLFILFWILWVAMLVGAIVIVVVTPKCAPKPQLAWWQKSAIYHVYVKSFKDSTGDGKGDIKGLTSQADYLKDLGVGALMLSPIYPSGGVDNGYDITDYMGIDGDMGTLEDFDAFIDAMKERDIKVLLDFVPNHSSSQHPWFIKSEQRKEPYTDYYIWQNATAFEGEEPVPPNNWVSVFGGSAWKWSDQRKQFYLHQFTPEQPDLNLRSEHVKQELKNVLEFWLNRGVHGFRIDAVSHLFEDKEFKDEPLSEDPQAKPGSYDTLLHIYTKGQKESLHLLAEWKELLLNFTPPDANTTKFDPSIQKILITEGWEPIDSLMKYYGESSYPLAEIPLNFGLLGLKSNASAAELKSTLSSWVSKMPEGMWPNWVLGNHDVSRVTSRFGPELLDGLTMVVMLARGTPILYYGDELGMEDLPALDVSSQKDVAGQSRAKSRSPMQWDNSTHAGFTSGIPWLPVHPSYPTVNVEFESTDPTSHLSLFKELVKLRQQTAVKEGEMDLCTTEDGDVFILARVVKGSPGLAAILNLSPNSTTANLPAACRHLPEAGDLELQGGGMTTYKSKAKLKLNSLHLDPLQSLVVSFVPVLNG